MRWLSWRTASPVLKRCWPAQTNRFKTQSHMRLRPRQEHLQQKQKLPGRLQTLGQASTSQRAQPPMRKCWTSTSACKSEDAVQLFYVLVMSCERNVLGTPDSARDAEGAVGWGCRVRGHLAVTHRRSCTSLPAPSKTTRQAPWMQWTYSPRNTSAGTTVAEPLKVALIQRGVEDTVVLNHFVIIISRLNTYAFVREEVHNITCTRAALVSMPAPMDLSVVEKGK